MSKKKGLFRRFVDAVSPGGKRRFEAAQVDRDSIEQFARVGYERPVDEDLAEDLPTMRTRCRDVVRNNALVRGVVETHKSDVVGPHGPSLDVQSEDEQYNREAEDIWREFTRNCDYNRQLHFVDFLRQDIELSWIAGESITQTLYDSMAPTQMKWRLLAIAPDRLDTPYQMFGDPDIVLGVRLTRSGRPTAYYISEPSRIGPYRYETGEFTELPASGVQHVYEQIEPGQTRGIPWLASSLRAISQSNSFDRETMEAARTAALLKVIMETQPGVTELEDFAIIADQQLNIPNRSIGYAAPGYTAKTVSSNHPNNNYIDFQHEQYRKIGRPVGMPLLTVLLDARTHNYSSARYDGQVYRRHLNVIQSRLTRQRCNPCANQALLDAERLGLIRRRPASVSLVWGWSQPPEIDEYKSAQADQLELSIGSKSLSEVCASRNRNFEEVVRQRLRDDEFLQANGLPTVAEMIGGMTASQPSNDQQEDQQGNRFFVGMRV